MGNIQQPIRIIETTVLKQIFITDEKYKNEYKNEYKSKEYKGKKCLVIACSPGPDKSLTSGLDDFEQHYFIFKSDPSLADGIELHKTYRFEYQFYKIIHNELYYTHYLYDVIAVKECITRRLGGKVKKINKTVCSHKNLDEITFKLIPTRTVTLNKRFFIPKENNTFEIGKFYRFSATKFYIDNFYYLENPRLLKEREATEGEIDGKNTKK
jgi:hypothetical protein